MLPEAEKDTPTTISIIESTDEDQCLHRRSGRSSPPPPPDASRIRLAVKDNIAAQGLPTTCASRILTGHEVPFTATIVAQIESRLGAELWGKTNMDEFGMGTHSTNTPYGSVHLLEGRSAGGSSGGSAVAVGLGQATVALGTDTGGSIRMPAAYTNTVGFKPSYGMLSRWGVVPYANSLDTVGLIAKEVAPIQEIIQAVCMEHDPKDPTSLPATVRERCVAERQYYPSSRSTAPDLQAQGLRGLTFGLPIEYNIEELSPRIKEGWMQVTDKIKEQGGRVVPVSLPSTKSALSAYYVIAPAEAASNLSKYDGIRYGKRASASDSAEDSDTASSDALNGILYAKTRGEGFGPEVKRRILLGSYTLSSEAVDNYFKQAQRVRCLVRRDFDRVFRLSNPLLENEHDDGSNEQQQFDLSDMDESVPLESKFGPTQIDFLLCPTAPTTPPKLSDIAKQTPFDSYMNDVFTVPASLAGLPAISIPMALPKSEEDLVDFGGVQLIGQFWDDARLLAVAGHIRSKQQ
ncbi:amidase signature domain-containing protein [Apiospora hydei]|uniref:Glutamyl-tRNA(Gln) amidotransferase subunit A, mitochondrial n=1 Tax=Apiospora hydei TaxID=1337664 RepID=A0ABR1VII4_9PEZI